MLRPILDSGVRNIDRHHSFQNDVELFPLVSMMNNVFKRIIPLEVHVVDQLPDLLKCKFLPLIFEVLVLEHLGTQRILLLLFSLMNRYQKNPLDFLNVCRMRLRDCPVFVDVGLSLRANLVQKILCFFV